MNKNAIVIVVISLLLLAILKAPFLHLPFYWDEAWSYIVAVNDMYLHKITLLPSDVNQEIFRGHPLFFYALTGLFARISGITPMSMHIWMLLLTGVCASYFYVLTKRLFDTSIALLAFVFLLFQEIIIVQSSFLLPEILIAFLTMYCFYFYLRKQLIPYLIAGFMLVLTKESGIVAIMAVCLHALFLSIMRKDFTFKVFHQILLLSIPIWLFVFFIVLQKLTWGWYLFPGHTALMNFSKRAIYDRLIGFFNFIFYEQHRIYYTIVVLLFLTAGFLFKRKSFMKLLNDERIWLFLIFTCLYCAFSAVNFYSARYLISLLPVSAIVAACIISTYIQDLRKLSLISIATGLFFILTYIFLSSDELGDTSKNYTSVVNSQKEMFDQFIEPHRLSSFGGSFLMDANLKHKELGYLKGDTAITSLPPEQAEFVVTTCIDPDEIRIKSWLKSGRIQLIYENKDGLAWSRVYKRN